MFGWKGNGLINAFLTRDIGMVSPSLYLALAHGRTQVVDYLLTKGCEIDARVLRDDLDRVCCKEDENVEFFKTVVLQYPHLLVDDVTSSPGAFLGDEDSDSLDDFLSECLSSCFSGGALQTLVFLLTQGVSADSSNFDEAVQYGYIECADVLITHGFGP